MGEHVRPIRKFATNIAFVVVFSIVAVLAFALLVSISMMTVEGPVILDHPLSLTARCGGKPLVTATRYWRTLSGVVYRRRAGCDARGCILTRVAL